MSLTITPIYAGLLGLFYVALSLWVVKVRVKQRVGSGDKGDPVMQNAMRTHANFAEYVPMGLILIALTEVQGMGLLGLHLLGVGLLISRLMHAFGMGRMPHRPPLRGGGATLTFVVLLVAAVSNLVLVVWA